MIRYALACDQAHEFESWFPSSDAYDAQRKRGLVACPVCGSGKVEKQIMAPRLARTDREPAGGPPAPVPSAPAPAPVPDAPAPQPMAIFSEKERELRAMLKALREHVQQNADHVGDRFPEEARKMHYGESEHRSIYGEATPMEARELIEEGIEIHPLPIIADERN
jgi:hypothetical protein